MAKLTKVGRIGVDSRGNEKIVAGLVSKYSIAQTTKIIYKISST